MPMITTSDGTEIFYKDWGSGQPIVFSHGWPPAGDSVENPFYPELRTPNCVAAFCPIMRAISASGTPALRSSAMASHALVAS
jgi:pimeloyl-ACP methyl ester carboxylesterase